MEQNRIVLKDGTTIPDGFASRSSRNQLMIRVPGSDLSGAVILLGDPEKNEVIICYAGIHKTTYIGYTHMYSAQYFSDNNYVELWFEPPEDGKTSMEREITVPKEYVPAEKEMNANA